MSLRETNDEDLLAEVESRGIKALRSFSDTMLNNELTRRRNEAMKRYNEMMEQGLV